jgi:ABC-type antimicrobial peptide transport system permease subunit
LTRAHRGQRELAIRAALGAEPRTAGAPVLTESVGLGFLGGAAGCCSPRSARTCSRRSRRPSCPAVDIAIDRQVLTYTVGASLLTSLLFGLVPALHASRRDSVGL